MALFSRKSFLVSIPALLLALVGCTSRPYQSPTFTEATYPGAPKVVYMSPTDRFPAQDAAPRWEPAPAQVRVRSANDSAMVGVTVNRVNTYTTNEPKTVYQDEWQDVFIPNDTCYEVQCSGGTGKSPAWDRFYQGGRRPSDLDDAIKGIGKVSAPKLVANGYFSSKPRSWSAFTAEINRAANSGVIGKGEATQVLNTYRSENIINLGYSANNCTERAYSCDHWVYKLVPVAHQIFVPVTHKQVIDQRGYSLNVKTSNAKLLSTEFEDVGFSINENGMVLEQNVVGNFNSYRISSTSTGPSGAGGQSQVTLVGESRIPRDLSSNVVSKDSFAMVGPTPTFTLDVDSNYLPTNEDPNSQLTVDYTVKYCDLGIFGTCKAFAAYKDLTTGSANLIAAHTAIPIAPSASKKLWLEYTLTRRNSQFFSGKPTALRTTSDIKM